MERKKSGKIVRMYVPLIKVGMYLCVYMFLGSREGFSLKCYQVIAGFLFCNTFQYYYDYYLEFEYIWRGEAILYLENSSLGDGSYTTL